MKTSSPAETWAEGEAYDRYVGRWSREVAPAFLEWLAAPSHGRWLDVGCGTGALIETILAVAEPTEIEGIDTSAPHVSYAMNALHDDRVVVKVADAREIPYDDSRFDVVVSGLAINFVPEPDKALGEMVRVTRTGGLVAAYVWDYQEGMAMMRHFWNAANAVDPDAASFDGATRAAAICTPDALTQLFSDAGLQQVETTLLDIETRFQDFNDYWHPFLGGQGTAPGYLASRPAEVQEAIREQLRADLPAADDGSITLTARALAVRGTVTFAGDVANPPSQAMLDQKRDDLNEAIDELRTFDEGDRLPPS